MKIRLLLATPDAASLHLFEAVLASALDLLPLDVVSEHAGASSMVLSRAAPAALHLWWRVSQMGEEYRTDS